MQNSDFTQPETTLLDKLNYKNATKNSINPVEKQGIHHRFRTNTESVPPYTMDALTLSANIRFD